MRFKGVNRPLPEIAAQLHVDAVLEGSVLLVRGDRSRSDDDRKRVRINARLILAGTDTQVWNRTFERVVDDVIALQTDVANAVTEGINQRLAGRTPPMASQLAARGIQGTQREQNFDAYDLYLKGRYLGNQRTREVLERSVQYFQQAIQRDPNFAAAYSGLADAYNVLGNYGFMRHADAVTLSSAAAEKALSLDPLLAEAHLSLALVHEDRFEWAQAEERFMRALQLNPELANAHHLYADYLAIRGRIGEATKEIERALALDPLSAAVNTEFGALLILDRRDDAAIAQLQNALKLDPSLARAHMLVAEAYAHKRTYALAVAAADRAAALNSGDTELRAGVGYIYAVAGRRSEALDIVAELEVRLVRGEDAALGNLAAIYAGLNDRDKAFERLDRARDLRDPSVDYLILDPRFDTLRSDARFAKLLASLGLT